jgi:hypothetical protein
MDLNTENKTVDITETVNENIEATSDSTVEEVIIVEEPQSNDAGSCRVCPAREHPIIAGAVIIAAILLIILMAVSRKRRKSQSGRQAKGNKAAKSSDSIEIYVGNLSYDMNDSQLRKEFERYGIVKTARVITHRTSGKSKGYGFVEMPHRKEAMIAIKALDTTDVMGRRIRVNEARANTRPNDR